MEDEFFLLFPDWEMVDHQAEVDHRRQIWTSQLRRTLETAEHIECDDKTSFPALNELDSGDLDEITYEEFERRFPAEFSAREEDKLGYRYPGGESYVDVCR